MKQLIRTEDRIFLLSKARHQFKSAISYIEQALHESNADLHFDQDSIQHNLITVFNCNLTYIENFLKRKKI